MGSSLFGLLDDKRLGVIHLERSGRIMATNDRALGILRRRDGLFDQGGFLRARLPADNTALQQLLAAALPDGGAPPASGSMTIQRPASLHRLVLHVNPIDFQRQDFAGWPVAAAGAGAGARKLVGRGPGHRGRRPGPYRHGKPGSGRPGRKARRCGTSRWNWSARKTPSASHVKQIHHKLGISRRGELVRLVLSLAGGGRFPALTHRFTARRLPHWAVTPRPNYLHYIHRILGGSGTGRRARW